ncbi:MAG: DUF4202 domain-containing protein [Candidatus Omnitrophica bacterium]|nr:DUF4202 domain-containing protein [Candidatus Omnitrophota bacterium]
MIPSRLDAVLRRIDELNRQDPNTDVVAGASQPHELAYAQRLTDWVLRLNPNASEILRIAARGQHVQRWTIPRSRYPMNRAGYLKWREVLKAFHIETVQRLMRESGYDEASCAQVGLIMSKKALGADPDTQTLEDALCLVFLETQFDELRRKTPDDKMRVIVQKTWLKLSPQGRAAALALPFGAEDQRWLARAVGGSESSSR